MNRASERELPNLRGVRDRLIVNVASHIVDETFCLVVPTDGANYCLWNSWSRRGMNLVAMTYKTNKAPAVVCRPAF